jgi:tetratricopeptide (TPR) repeat protein
MLITFPPPALALCITQPTALVPAGRLINNTRYRNNTNKWHGEHMKNRHVSVLLFLALFAVAPAHAAFNDELAALQQHWANARYQTTGDARKTQLQKLIDEADAFTKKYSDKADGYLWAGVIRGSLAEAINGIDALGIVKESKTKLEKAIELDPKAEDSYALGVLGLMYAKVPGWPIGFGDEKKAKELLKKGLEISPDGMNINYLYASYLFDSGDYKKALVHIQKAEQATPPAPVDMWSGRQQEIRELAAKIQNKLK